MAARRPLVSAVLAARWPALCAVPLTIALGLAARAWFTGLPAKVAGDALYTVLVYNLAFVVRPTLPGRRALAIALGVSFAMEFAQLTPYPAWLSSKHVVLRLIFGTTFGFTDLAGYVVGALAVLAARALVQAARGRSASATPPAEGAVPAAGPRRFRGHDDG